MVSIPRQGNDSLDSAADVLEYEYGDERKEPGAMYRYTSRNMEFTSRARGNSMYVCATCPNYIWRSGHTLQAHIRLDGATE